MNNKLITTLCLTTLLTITGCATTKETSNSYTSSYEDSTKPIITLVSDSVTVEKGTNYSAKDNIKSVTDDIDGTLEYAKSAQKGSAYYLIDDSKVDTSKVGTYKVTVTATDKTGNVETKEFNVVVEDKDATASDTEKTKSTEKSETKSESTNTDKKSSTTKSEETTEKNTSKKTNTSSKKATSSSSSSSASGTQSSKAQTSNQSNSNQSASTQQQTCHNVHHDATGHYENQTTLKNAAWDETVVEQPAWDEQAYDGTVTVCNGCGQEFNSYEEWQYHYKTIAATGDWSHASYHSYDTYNTVHHDATYKTVHHDAEYETNQVWIEDSAAYDETVCN